LGDTINKCRPIITNKNFQNLAKIKSSKKKIEFGLCRIDRRAHAKLKKFFDKKKIFFVDSLLIKKIRKNK